MTETVETALRLLEANSAFLCNASCSLKKGKESDKFVAEVACLDPQLSLNEITREEYSEKKIKSGWRREEMRGSRKFTCLWVSVPVLWGRRWSSWRGPSNSSVGTFLPQPGDNPFRPHQWCLQALLSLDKCDYFWHSNLKCQSRFNSKTS